MRTSPVDFPPNFKPHRSSNAEAFIWIFHLFVIALFTLATVLAPDQQTGIAVLRWGACAAYVAVLVGMWRLNRWCMWLSMIPPVAVLIWFGPAIADHAWALVSGHALYQDSPGTILMLAGWAAVTVVPAFATLVAYWFGRKQLFGRGRG